MMSIVGIVAVMMLIVAGMRYITAAGNAASITDAKSIASSAITALLLALLSFVILKTINPDVPYLKRPCSNFGVASQKNMATCGIYDPAASPDSNCTCNNGTKISATSGTTCHEGCNTYCSEINTKSCIDPIFPFNSSLKLSDAGLTNCKCVNGEEVSIEATNCQDACAPNNCLVADLRVGDTPNPIAKIISIAAGQTLYLNALFSMDYKAIRPNGISRYEIDYDDNYITIRDEGCTDGYDCGLLHGFLGDISSTIWDHVELLKKHTVLMT